MSMFGWLKNWNPFSSNKDLMNIVVQLTVADSYKRLAIDACVNLIADAFARCEFKTMENNKSVKKINYYLMNVAPNQNENAVEFWKKIIYKLYYDNEVLVIPQNEMWYVADSFDKEEYAFKENTYSGVTIGDLSLTKTFKESQVFYFKLNNENVMNVINTLYSDYGSLISSARDIYKRSNAKRLVLKGDFFRPQNDKRQEQINEMLTAQFKPWLEANNAGAIFQLQDGYVLEDLSGNGKSGANKNDSRDVRNLVDDIFDFVSSALHVPRGLVKGDVVNVKELVNYLLMFGLLPLIDLISAEVNKKWYKPEDYLNGNYIKIDATNIKVTDLSEQAAGLDKLFAIGAISINDIIERIGGERINEEWADKRYVTKNYADASAPEGGEKN